MSTTKLHLPKEKIAECLKQPVGQAQSNGSSVPITSALSKWVPVICAGAAVGISIMAVKELKSFRKDLLELRKEQLNLKSNTSNQNGDNINKEFLNELMKKITMMENQIKQVREVVNEKNKNAESKSNFKKTKERYSDKPDKSSYFVNSVVESNNNVLNKMLNEQFNVVNVVNGVNEENDENDEEVEYEEVEVTDDENEN